MAEKFTEDQIRERGGEILGFEDTETAKSGVGQLTSWTSLGFNGVKGAPDGWYLPNIKVFPAIIAEFKASSVALKQPQIDEILKNCEIARTQYPKVIGILWNGEDILVYKDGELLPNEKELHNKEYYLGLYEENKIDQQQIFLLTKRINDSLHVNFGIKNLYHRMIFTACALVAKRYGATLVKGMNYSTFHNSILSTLQKSYEEERKQNTKLDLLGEVYAEIKMNITSNQEAIDDFIACVTEISDNLNSDFWNGEDVMAIFFNEFNRYKGKSEQGQVFTPDHITSLIYRITGTTKEDIVLDAACGSGAFLVKSMCNMIKEAGGNRTTKAKEIKTKQLFGIEKDREIYALACANMLIHKDGKTNIEQLDSSSPEAAKWIVGKGITKVQMNPPFENKYKCVEIVENVLNSVAKDVICAFIMPDNKLETNAKKAKRILKKHCLEKIIKLPEEIFSGVTTSIFIFRANVPQKDKQIFACCIEKDGLETVKNQGRQDVKNRWQAIEDYWVDVIYKQSGNDTIQWLNPAEHLSYQMPQPPFEITEADFRRTVLSYVLFQKGINEQEFKQQVVESVLYGCPISDNYDFLEFAKQSENKVIDITTWKEFKLVDLFYYERGTRLKVCDRNAGNLPLVTAGELNQGVKDYIEQGKQIVYKNAITIDMFCNSFVHLEEFCCDDNVLVLTAKEPMNEQIMQFVCCVINADSDKWDYVKQYRQNSLENHKILLPATPDGDPDFQFMEDYIKGLPYSGCLWCSGQRIKYCTQCHCKTQKFALKGQR